MEAQWAACEEAFIDTLPDKEGMPVERYERIKDVLARWDDLSPAERRELSGGNQAYWYKKYSYMATEDGEGEADGGDHGDLADADTGLLRGRD